jgi:1,4-alpha-glucan branching enzyme
MDARVAKPSSIRAVLENVTRGCCGNPFAVLGRHRESGGWQVRTYQPHVRSVSVVDTSGKLLSTAEPRYAEGVFIAALPPRKRHYLLRLDDGERRYDVEDPYRFPSPLGELDVHLIGEGRHHRLYEKLGAHPMRLRGVDGVHFAVWAPNASRVSVVGSFNDWDGRRCAMRFHADIGVWDIFLPGVDAGALYKFELLDRDGALLPLKTDPFASRCEPPPGNASIVYASDYKWRDDDWRSSSANATALDRPQSIYEVHFGSWRRRVEDGSRWLSYRELASELVEYVVDMGFTHIELLPLMEHPFDGSWGYQPIGLYAPTWRYGEPDDLKFFIDACHANGIGVILDWVPAHFPRDEHGLGRFDGTALYEHSDPRRSEHPDWGTLVFDYGRREVVNYLITNALYWADEFHIDGLRVDAVASMLYLDYSREDGEWLPNERGGNENLDAIAFLQRLNEEVHQRRTVTIAEESTAWSGVSRPTYSGGLGFSFKWNMGWMNDTLSYIREDPVHRRYHHDRMTFGLMYAFEENFILPLSHDEVVHGKGSLLEKMPGDDWQKFANLRALYAFMYGYPGKKLLFMGSEFAQRREWTHDHSLDWHLCELPSHRGVQQLVRDLNRLYRSTGALFELDFDPDGFEWIDWSDRDSSVFSWVRRDRHGRHVVVVSNLTPVVRKNYCLGVPTSDQYVEVINTDATEYGGTGVGNFGVVDGERLISHGRPYSLRLTLPPLATLILVPNVSKQIVSGVDG